MANLRMTKQKQWASTQPTKAIQIKWPGLNNVEKTAQNIFNQMMNFEKVT